MYGPHLTISVVILTRTNREEYTISLCKSCRSRQELSNEYLLAKFGVDTAENEPLKDHFIIQPWDLIFTVRRPAPATEPQPVEVSPFSTSTTSPPVKGGAAAPPPAARATSPHPRTHIDGLRIDGERANFRGLVLAKIYAKTQRLPYGRYSQ